jgi:DNA-binding response OmpR family regulator
MILWVDEFKLAGYDVDVRTNVDDALDVFQKRGREIDLFVIDLMNAPGKTFAAADTKLGRRTGVLFYETLRRLSPEIPVVILTNVTSTDLRNRFDSESNCRWLRKDRCLPFELVAEVDNLLRGTVK